eukprot:CAMPEP_0174709466 /NCGR_PEP_ID=MMETSP1094-20130205/11414_1 /TAXON_ID=156173 /ORGANISM="Chrysochromulina brevifilum, Strain UTEX LB 985" /LENGTH=79 /DNA_ID=CAMNT_0015908149 /DNA_START=317 /DNA_END=556 /DNA_ORIENTATION=-
MRLDVRVALQKELKHICMALLRRRVHGRALLAHVEVNQLAIGANEQSTASHIARSGGDVQRRLVINIAHTQAGQAVWRR